MLPLARSLFLADVLTHETLTEALFVSATRGVSLVRALLTLRAVDRPRLEQHLERGDVPYMRHVTSEISLVGRLPRGLCERLLALPVRHDALTGTVDVAVLDASDPHPAEEIAHWLKAPVRIVRTSLSSLEAALRRTNVASTRGMHALAPPMGMAPTEHAASETGNDRREPATEQNIPVPLTRRMSGLGPGEPTDVTKIVSAIRAEADRDAILELVLTGAQTIGRVAAILAVKRGTLVGWTCSPSLADRTAFRAIRLELAQTVFVRAFEREGVDHVRIPSDVAHAALRSIWNSLSASEVAVVGIRVDRRPVALVLVSLPQRTSMTRRLEEIAHAAEAGITKALRQRRK
jgi:hypothetical protein